MHQVTYGDAQLPQDVLNHLESSEIPELHDLFASDSGDRRDAYAHKDHDEIYHKFVAKTPVGRWKFTAVDGVFRQSSETTDDMSFRYTNEDFGLIGSWDQMRANLTSLNGSHQARDGATTRHIVLLLARHGEGYHNVASAKYAGPEWLNKWRFLGTDGVLVWGPDPELTEKGILQARVNGEFLQTQLDKGMPMPSKHYVSPLQRSISTMLIEWQSQQDYIKPVVVDKLRETIGCNLCHKRSPKSVIAQKFPQLAFEPGFPEEDVLDMQHAGNRETFWQQFVRIDQFLQDLFDNKLGNSDTDDVVSVTCHAGTIRAFLTVLGHRSFTIPKGGMIPVVIRAEAAVTN